MSVNKIFSFHVNDKSAKIRQNNNKTLRYRIPLWQRMQKPTHNAHTNQRV